MSTNRLPRDGKSRRAAAVALTSGSFLPMFSHYRSPIGMPVSVAFASQARFVATAEEICPFVAR
jgi:hypothetical protein